MSPTWGTTIPSTLPTSVCPLPALPVWPLLGSAGAGPGGGPRDSEGAWMPGAGGMSSALQEIVDPAKRVPGLGAVPRLRQSIEAAMGIVPTKWEEALGGGAGPVAVPVNPRV